MNRSRRKILALLLLILIRVNQTSIIGSIQNYMLRSSKNKYRPIQCLSCRMISLSSNNISSVTLNRITSRNVCFAYRREKYAMSNSKIDVEKMSKIK